MFTFHSYSKFSIHIVHAFERDDLSFRLPAVCIDRVYSLVILKVTNVDRSPEQWIWWKLKRNEKRMPWGQQSLCCASGKPFSRSSNNCFRVLSCSWMKLANAVNEQKQFSCWLANTSSARNFLTRPMLGWCLADTAATGGIDHSH